MPSGVDREVAIAPGNSTSVSQAIATFTYNLEDNETYTLVADGIVSGSGHSPATPFDICVNGASREVAQGSGTDVLVFHGSTDAPTVQVAETAILGGELIVARISYGEFSNYLEVPNLDFVLQVQLPDGTPVISYQALLESLGLDGAAITILESGFLNPANNSNGADFGLRVALATGGPLVPLPITTGISERDALLNSLKIWPNPSSDRIFVQLDSNESAEATLQLTDLSGRAVRSIDLIIAAGLSSIELPVDNLANGSYTLSILSSNSLRSVPVQVAR